MTIWHMRGCVTGVNTSSGNPRTACYQLNCYLPLSVARWGRPLLACRTQCRTQCSQPVPLHILSSPWQPAYLSNNGTSPAAPTNPPHTPQVLHVARDQIPVTLYPHPTPQHPLTGFLLPHLVAVRLTHTPQVLHVARDQIPVTVTLANIISRAFPEEYEERRREAAGQLSAGACGLTHNRCLVGGRACTNQVDSPLSAQVVQQPRISSITGIMCCAGVVFAPCVTPWNLETLPIPADGGGEPRDGSTLNKSINTIEVAFSLTYRGLGTRPTRRWRRGTWRHAGGGGRRRRRRLGRCARPDAVPAAVRDVAADAWREHGAQHLRAALPADGAEVHGGQQEVRHVAGGEGRRVGWVSKHDTNTRVCGGWGRAG